MVFNGVILRKWDSIFSDKNENEIHLITTDQ